MKRKLMIALAPLAALGLTGCVAFDAIDYTLYSDVASDWENVRSPHDSIRISHRAPMVVKTDGVGLVVQDNFKGNTALKHYYRLDRAAFDRYPYFDAIFTYKLETNTGRRSTEEVKVRFQPADIGQAKQAGVFMFTDMRSTYRPTVRFEFPDVERMVDSTNPNGSRVIGLYRKGVLREGTYVNSSDYAFHGRWTAEGKIYGPAEMRAPDGTRTFVVYRNGRRDGAALRRSVEGSWTTVAYVNDAIVEGKTPDIDPVDFAIENDHLHAMVALAEDGQGAGWRDERGRNLLFYAYGDGSHDLSEVRSDLLARMIVAGVVDDLTDRDGRTAGEVYEIARADWLAEEERRRVLREAAEARAEERRAEQRRENNRLAQLRREQEEAERRIRQQREHEMIMGAINSAKTQLAQAGAEMAADQRRINELQRQIRAEEERQRDMQRMRNNQISAQNAAEREAERREAERAAQAAEAARQAALERGRQRQQEIYDAVNRRRSEPASGSSGGTRLALRNHDEKPRENFPGTRPARVCKPWTEKAYAACDCQAETVALKDHRNDNQREATLAYKVGCGVAWSGTFTRYYDDAPPIKCGKKGEFDERVARRLAEQGLSSHAAYATQAWNDWAGALGCDSNNS
ncbi:hypothetical protein [Sphingomicrobium aestuariivivum]|uniref:hypothetical protein n=1 Tax=Sphingomicrobium aestuariivivum TaxID=1582356 RepID=UPI001FD7167B|nr:hypothetical protein [Sphingomicrobium aestuariivivum]MCJ8190521.1 hypothetical protein [Sphingomicrobium aestuariivivum]